MMAVFAVDPEEFDLDLWRGCFDFMFTLLSSDQVRLLVAVNSAEQLI
jgi:hypothetical protein